MSWNTQKEARAAESGEFEIIPLVSNGLMKSGSISGELTAMDADNTFTGYIANMMFDLEFMLIENSYEIRGDPPRLPDRGQLAPGHTDPRRFGLDGEKQPHGQRQPVAADQHARWRSAGQRRAK